MYSMKYRVTTIGFIVLFRLLSVVSLLWSALAGIQGEYGVSIVMFILFIFNAMYAKEASEFHQKWKKESSNA